jgi:hypothetical protein
MPEKPHTREDADDGPFEAPADVDLLIAPRPRDLGDGFVVRRILPYAKRRMVGPFIFLDEMGPVDFAPGTGLDVRPHPHIGLATVTYLFDGEIRHRDSLGYDQIIRPGDVNWMTAGRGIVHSERTADGPRALGQRLHGVQSWIALPEEHAETVPAFFHHPGAAIPVLQLGGATLRLIAGRALSAVSPVKTFSPMFYLAVEAEAGAAIPLPGDYEERAAYVVSGRLSVHGSPLEASRMAAFRPGSSPSLRAEVASRVMLLGGAPLGARHIWWNFVASRQERIDQARRDWEESAEKGYSGTPFALPPGENAFIPPPQS